MAYLRVQLILGVYSILNLINNNSKWSVYCFLKWKKTDEGGHEWGLFLQSQTATLQGIWCQDDINQPSAWKIKQINVLKYENFISYWTDE